MTGTIRVNSLGKTVIQKNRNKCKKLSEPGSGIVFCYFKKTQRVDIVSLHLITYENDKPKWHKLGRYPATSIEDARQIASKINARKSRLKELRAEQAQFEIDKVDDVLALYVNSLKLESGNASESRIRNAVGTISKHIGPNLGRYKWHELSHSLVYEKLYAKMVSSSYSLSYIDIAIRTLKAAFNFALKLQLIEQNPMSQIMISSLTDRDIRPKQMQIETYEIKKAIDDIKKKKCIKTRMLCVTMLMYATRLEETTKLNWSSLDFDGEVWIVREENTKTRKRHVLPLTDQATAIFRLYRRLRRKTNNRGALLFPAKTKPKTAITKTYACAKISKDSKFTSHDFRKVARSWWQQNKIDYYIGEMLLNHTKSDTDKAYIQGLLLDSCKDALTKWHEHLVACGIMQCLE